MSKENSRRRSSLYERGFDRGSCNRPLRPPSEKRGGWGTLRMGSSTDRQNQRWATQPLYGSSTKKQDKVGHPALTAGAEATTTVTHFTSDAGVQGITDSGGVLRSGTYVTTPGEIPAGSTSGDVESILEIGPGKGTNSITFDTPNSNLAIPENGSTTSGGATQFQLNEPTRVDPTKFMKTDPD